jgi:RNA polymerase sigma factor (TIGR02999 family)
MERDKAPASAARPGEVTALLRAWGHGDLQARDGLMPLVYRDLRKRAARYLRHERPGHSLQPTALVHEAYLRLVGQHRIPHENRAQFLALAAHMMRRILVDHARARRAAKRPGADVQIALDDRIGATSPQSCDLLLLDQALSELATADPQQARIVELRYFGGLAEHEVADLIKVSRSTVTREWRLARAWLYRRMTEGRRPGD